MKNILKIVVIIMTFAALLGCETTQEKAVREQKAAQEKVEAEQRAKAEADRKQQEDSARKARELLGDSIPCQINTVANPFENYCCNPNISNVRTFINRNTAMITVVFDFNTKIPKRRSPEGLCQCYDAFQFFIRVFDRNGQYLLNFATTEYFTTPASWPREHREHSAYKIIALKDSNNLLQYQINMRDASFVAQAEFGCVWNVR